MKLDFIGKVLFIRVYQTTNKLVPNNFLSSKKITVFEVLANFLKVFPGGYEKYGLDPALGGSLANK